MVSSDAVTPDLPPELLEEYLAGVRKTLGLLASLAERLVASGDDSEALDALQHETHKIRGSAGSYGFTEASRLAAGMEATIRDWAAGAIGDEVDRGSLARWFVARLAGMLGLPVPQAASPPLAAAPRRALPTAGPGSPRRPPTAPFSRPTGPAPARQSPPRRAVPRSAGATTTPPAPLAPRPGPNEARPVSLVDSVSVRPPPAPQPADVSLAAPAAAPPSSAGSVPVPEVISVEDDAALAELLEYGLRARGYRFKAYRNGRDALRDLLALDVQSTHPLLLLDVDLPALDGYSIFDALQRARPGTYRVVFTTVHGTEEEQLRGLEAGALDYLVKPISLRVALEKIKRWVGR